jgi:hypothetical protein
MRHISFFIAKKRLAIELELLDMNLMALEDIEFTQNCTIRFRDLRYVTSMIHCKDV